MKIIIKLESPLSAQPVFLCYKILSDSLTFYTFIFYTGGTVVLKYQNENGTENQLIGEWGELIDGHRLVKIFAQEKQVKLVISNALENNFLTISDPSSDEWLYLNTLSEWFESNCAAQVELFSVVARKAEDYGRYLAEKGASFNEFNNFRMMECQWVNGPMEYDTLVDCWKDAVWTGYSERVG